MLKLQLFLSNLAKCIVIESSGLNDMINCCMAHGLVANVYGLIGLVHTKRKLNYFLEVGQ